MELPPTARLLDRFAHHLRNDLNIVTGGLSLLDARDAGEAELLEDTRAAASAVSLAIARLVVAARLEIDGVEPLEPRRADETLQQAMRRARREGVALDPQGGDGITGADALMLVAPLLADRILADLVHVCARRGAPRVEVGLDDPGVVAVTVTASVGSEGGAERGATPVVGREAEEEFALALASTGAAAMGGELMAHLGSDDARLTLTVQRVAPPGGGR